MYTVLLSALSFLAGVTLGLGAPAAGEQASYQGKASWDALGTTPCPVSCPLTDFRVALPVDLFPNGERCCDVVLISYEGKDVDATFTDLYLAGEGTFNISLSHQAFAVLAPLELGQIYPVTWHFENKL